MTWIPFKEGWYISGSAYDGQIMKRWKETNEIKEIVPLVSGSRDYSQRTRYTSDGNVKG